MPTTFRYDVAGNVTNDGVHTYQYDAENRLVRVDNGATAQYKYDHQNRRVSKIIGSSWTHYVWQGSQVIGEHDATTAYTTNPTYQVNSARLDYIYSGSQRIYSRERASSGGTWTTKYYLSDRLSTRVVLNTSGNVLGRQGHLPFGEDFGESGTQEKHHFTTYERNNESGTDYAVNRQYAMSVGRFMSVDSKAGSIRRPQGLNRYAYVMNDSINKIDPDGRDGLVISGGHIYLINCHQNVNWVGEWDDGEWDADPSNGETCERVDLGSIGTIPGPKTPAEPCDVTIPDDENIKAAVDVLLGEATSPSRLGQPQYQDGDRLGHPTGETIIDEAILYDEAVEMVGVIANRAARGIGGRTWKDVASSGAFLGYQNGKNRRERGRFGAKGSAECEELRRAVDAARFVSQNGSTDPNALYWVAVVQGKRRNRHVRQQGGATRIGDTDFSDTPF